MVKSTHPNSNSYSKQAGYAGFTQTNASTLLTATPQTIPSQQTPTPRVTASLSSLSDHELLMLCTQYGTQAKLLKQKFLGLLPEVERRQLYLTEGCSSVFEFAAKLGGVSKEQVHRVLQLHKRFESTPELKNALVSGEVTVHKLARIASVATPENQEFLLHQTKLLSKTALETLVKDTKKSVPGHSQKPNKTEKIAQFEELNLAPDVRQQLLDIKNKGLDLNQILRDLLQQRSQKIKAEKQNMAEELLDKKNMMPQKDNLLKADQGVLRSKPSSSRYIPAKVKYLLKQEYGDKCAQEHCINKATNIHHTRRFGLNPSHNPLFLAPLCTQHHEIAHSIDVRVRGHRKIS